MIDALVDYINLRGFLVHVLPGVLVLFTDAGGETVSVVWHLSLWREFVNAGRFSAIHDVYYAEADWYMKLLLSLKSATLEYH